MRYTLWVQGCPIKCPGCCNKDTWDPNGGRSVEVTDIIKGIKKVQNDLHGVTITGGEPTSQLPEIVNLCVGIRALNRNLSIFILTGHTEKTFEDCYLAHYQEDIRSYADIICWGPYKKEFACKDQWRGSTNQEIKPYKVLGYEQLKWPVISSEVHIKPNGNALETGFSEVPGSSEKRVPITRYDIARKMHG
jgi:anaerobic ribonucleoside-triphosphate reductase activating protein